MVSQRCDVCGHKLTAALTKLEKRDISCLCGKLYTLTGYWKWKCQNCGAVNRKAIYTIILFVVINVRQWITRRYKSANAYTTNVTIAKRRIISAKMARFCTGRERVMCNYDLKPVYVSVGCFNCGKETRGIYTPSEGQYRFRCLRCSTLHSVLRTGNKIVIKAECTDV